MFTVRSTSPLKSAWPGVSMMFNAALALLVAAVHNQVLAHFGLVIPKSVALF
jgi:hypothetical protein